MEDVFLQIIVPWETIFCLVVLVFIGVIEHFIINKAQRLDLIVLGYRLCWGLFAGVIGFLVVSVIKHIKGFDDHVNWLFELSAILAIVIAITFVTEPFLSFRVLSIRKSAAFDLAKNWKEFVEQKRFLDSSVASHLTLLLFECGLRDYMKIETMLSNYTSLLSAATRRTQKGWFATYTWNVEDWSNIAKHATNYFDALKDFPGEKLRVLVRGNTELTSVVGTHMIARDTSMSGAKLYKACTEQLSKYGLSEIDDFAIFDDSLVIAAELIQNNSDRINGKTRGVGEGNSGGSETTATTPNEVLDPEKTPVIVRLFRGDKASQHRYWKNHLEVQIKQGEIQKVV